MNYEVEITRDAQKQLARIPANVRERVNIAIRALAGNPRPSGCLKLTNRDSWRIRVGDFRVIYEIEDDVLVVVVVEVVNRRDAYKA